MKWNPREGCGGVDGGVRDKMSLRLRYLRLSTYCLKHC